MSNSESSATRPTIIDLEAVPAPDETGSTRSASSFGDTDSTSPDGTEPSTGFATMDVPPARKRGPLLTTGAAAVALLLAAGLGAWSYRTLLSDYYPTAKVQAALDQTNQLASANAALAEQMGALQRLSDQLKTDVDALEAKAAESSSTLSAAADGVTAAQQRLATAEDAIASLKASLASIPTGGAASGTAAPDATALAALTARVDALEKDLASLKQQDARPADMAGPLVQSLADLKAKVAAGTGFAPELERISRLVPAAPGLDVLQPYAQTGLANAQGLADELSQLAKALPAADAAPAEDETSLVGRVWSALSGLVVVRYQGEADWAKVAEAASALAATGDLAQAIAHINANEGAKPPGLQQWLERASARLNVEQALATVDAAVQRVLAAKG